jgi:hypothetical protein
MECSRDVRTRIREGVDGPPDHITSVWKMGLSSIGVQVVNLRVNPSPASPTPKMTTARCEIKQASLSIAFI